MTYLVFDLETETYEAYKRKASPFNPQNWVVARGWKESDKGAASYTYHPTLDRTSYLKIGPKVTCLIGFNIKFDLLWEMAQENPDLLAFFQRGGTVWDGQYAEYLLEGQHPDWQMCSLDQTAPKYGGTTKIDAVKAMWEAGIHTSEIPKDLLIDYLVGTEQELRCGGDIRNTELVFLGQIRRAQEMGMLKMIQDRMDGLLATTDMEFRGLKVNLQLAGQQLRELSIKLDEFNSKLTTYLPSDLPSELEWKWTRHQTSAIMFGGTLRYPKKAPYLDDKTGELARLKAHEEWPLFGGEAVDRHSPDVIFDTDTQRFVQVRPAVRSQDTYLSGKKSGEPKYRKVEVQGPIKTKYQDHFYKFDGYIAPNKDWAGEQTDGAGAPVYSTSGDVLDELATSDIPFLKEYAGMVALEKEIGTYYVTTNGKGVRTGMLTCVSTVDCMLHHKLNHTSTVTTRLSSSDPNLQNLPTGRRSKVKAIFVSRFTQDYCERYSLPYAENDNGVMVEADYSQLEVVVQGVLTRDPTLRQMLRDRIDFHCLRVSKKWGITYDEAKYLCKDESAPDHKLWAGRRTDAKVFSFQRAYGAGAVKISATTGIPLADVEELIRAESELFPEVDAFNADVYSSVVRTAVPFNALGSDGVSWHTYRRGYWKAPTGTRYSFRSYDPPAWARRGKATDTFMPTELKNYPIQGTGGEFVQGVALGKLWRRFVQTGYYGGRAYMVNTVHDCVWVDAHASVYLQVAREMKAIMESIPRYYNDRYGMDIDVPFPVDVSSGPNMFDLKHIDFKLAA